MTPAVVAGAVVLAVDELGDEHAHAEDEQNGCDRADDLGRWTAVDAGLVHLGWPLPRLTYAPGVLSSPGT